MEQILLFALIGLGTGSIYAAVATGIIVTYRSTGILNFAVGAMATWGVYVYDELRRTGDLLIPVVVIPHRFGLFGSGAGFLPAMTLGLASSALIGLLVHTLVFRPLRSAPVLAKVVASIGLLIAIQGLVALQFGPTPRVVPPILPTKVVTISGLTFPRDRLWLAGIVIAITVLLWAYFRFTRSGLATRALAENEEALALTGRSPQRLAAATMVLSSLAVGLVVIVGAPVGGAIGPQSFSLVLVGALAASLIGRLQSVAIGVTAALLLGSLQSVVTFLSSKSWWPKWAASGVGDALPFIIIVITLFAIGRKLPTRDDAHTDRLPDVPRPNISPRVVVPFVALGVVALVVLDGSYRYALTLSLIMTVMMLSVVLLTGYVGQISLATAALAGCAGFILSRWFDGLPLPLAIALSSAVATVLGVVAGIPALRIRGAQLAVVTLALAVALEKFVFRNAGLTPVEGNKIGKPSLFGIDLAMRAGRNVARLQFGLFALTVTVVACVVVGWLGRGKLGHRFLAVRSDERASAAVGIDVAGTKLTAFAISSFLAGVAGCMIGYSRGQLSAESFSTTVGLAVFAFAYLGGITSVSGAVVAGMLAPLGLVSVFADRIIHLGNSYALVGGLALVMTAIFNPSGIAAKTVADFHHAAAKRTAKVAAKAGRPAGGPTLAHAGVAGAAAIDAPAISAVPATSAPGAVAFTMPTRVEGALDNAPVVFTANKISVRFGGLQALNEVSLRIRAGEIVGVIGPNGAGKTTLIDAVSGFVAMTGDVDLDGNDLTAQTPHSRARAGLVRTWQNVMLFPDLTVEENLGVAARGRDKATVGDVDHDAVERALALLGLTPHRHRKPSEMPLGEQKLVGVARALAATPRAVLLDEPAAGLDSTESQRLGERLRAVAADGVGVLLVDHDMGLVLDVCDYLYVLDFGRLIAEGDPAAVSRDERVLSAYLGEVPA